MPGPARAVPCPAVDDLATLEADVTACRACPRLVEWRERIGREKRAAFADDDYWARPVPGFGDPTARLVVVGLAPAAHGANRTGRMFTGDRSGDVLYAGLHRAGYANQPTSEHATTVWCSTARGSPSPEKCAPPENKPTPAERDACAPFLARELDLLAETRVFLVLGGFGYQALARFLGLRPRPRFGHGVEVPLDGRTHDPGQLPREPAEHLHRSPDPGDARDDLARARRLTATPGPVTGQKGPSPGPGGPPRAARLQGA